MTQNKVATVVTIAGSDSSGGAGIQADIKTISALGGYAASIITALTAQNTQGVQGIYSIPHEFVTEQIDSVFSDLFVGAVKIGMLHDEAIIAAIVSGLKKYQPPHVVLDPVMVAKSGHELLRPQTLTFLKENLFPCVALLTPNICEAEKLLARKIQTREEQAQSARELGELFSTHVLVKGGHLLSEKSADVLYFFAEKRCVWFEAERIQTKNTHGTGCTLSAAIATNLAKGHSLIEAISDAKSYLNQALFSAKSLVFGHGCGPVNHSVPIMPILV